MSKVKSYLYYIEYKDGSDETMNKNTLESLVDNEFDSIFNKIKKIVKDVLLIELHVAELQDKFAVMQVKLVQNQKTKVNVVLLTI